MKILFKIVMAGLALAMVLLPGLLQARPLVVAYVPN